MIQKTSRGYEVLSESTGKNGKRKKLGGPYKTMKEAKKRLGEVEYFKNKG